MRKSDRVLHWLRDKAPDRLSWFWLVAVHVVHAVRSYRESEESWTLCYSCMGIHRFSTMVRYITSDGGEHPLCAGCDDFHKLGQVYRRLINSTSAAEWKLP